MRVVVNGASIGRALEVASSSGGISVSGALLWVGAFIGLWGALAGISASRRLTRHERFYRFRPREDVDMVLPTSDRTRGGAGISYVRSVTAVGNMTAATEIATVIGYGSASRKINVAVTAELAQPLWGDLVLVGLPVKNPVSGEVLKHINATYPDVTFRIDEADATAGGCRLTLGPFTGPYEVCAQPGTDFPDRDLALIVMWVNPLAVKKRRLIWCAGFTAYGTAAAASYLVDQVLPNRFKRLRKAYPGLPSLWRWKRWVCFAMVIEARIINDQVVDIIERAFVPLEDPGQPPFECPSNLPPDPRKTTSPGDDGDGPLGVNEVAKNGASSSDDTVALPES